MKAALFILTFGAGSWTKRSPFDYACERTRFYLIHIRERCQRILDDTGGIESTWPEIPTIYDAVCRSLEIIGEAASKIDADLRAANPDIPWRAMIDTRNILIHAYYRVAPDILVDIVKRDIPQLQASITRVLGDKET